MNIRENEQKTDLMQANKKYPFRRFFARSIDASWYYLMFYLICVGAGRIRLYRGNALSIMGGILTILLTVILEPVFLSRFSTTPGKWVFGIRVYNREGGRLSYSQALSRTIFMLKSGEGWGIPIYNIYRNYRSYKQYTGTGLMTGELPWDEDCLYTFKDDKNWRCFVCAVLNIAMIFCGLLFAAENLQPKYRGEITPEQFASNYNDYQNYFSGEFRLPQLVLEEGGSGFTDAASDDSGMGKFTWDSGTSTFISADGLPEPEFIYTQKDGILQSISLEGEYEGTDAISGYRTAMTYAVGAFVCAQKEVNIFNDKCRKILKYMEENTSGSFHFTEGNIEVSCQIENRGFEECGTFWIPEEENSAGYFRLRFLMEKVEHYNQ